MATRKRDILGKKSEKSGDKSHPSASADMKQVPEPATSNQRASSGSYSYICYLFFVLLIITAIVIYLLPSRIDPVAYRFSDTADGPPPPIGVFAPNNELQKARRLFEGELVGPEAFVADKDGYIYTGQLDGRVIKINPKTETFNLLTRMDDPPYDDCGKVEKMPSCGRPLGLQIDKGGDLLLVDSYKGLFHISTKSGEKQHLFKPEKTGKFSCLFINNLALHSNGSIFITCYSTKFAFHDLVLDTVEARANGKIFHYNPNVGHTAVLKEDLYSPNGIALSSTENFLVVSELTRARLIKYHLNGAKVGKWEILIDNLPGLVDNITPARHGPGFWAAGVVVRYGTMVDFMSDKPLIRLLAGKLQLVNVIEQTLPLHTMVMLISEEGSVTKCLQDQTGKAVYRTSEAFEFEGELYLGSYVAPFLGKLTL